MIARKYIIIIAVALVALQALILYFVLGNSLICPCGYVRVFDTSVRSSQNSQHFLDWYSFSHLISGIVTYFALWLVRRKKPWLTLGIAFLIAISVSVGWEIFENTQLAQRHLRDNTISTEYKGDSVLNSVMDTAAAAAGFGLAFVLPPWASVAMIVALEVFVLLVTRNNFVVTVVMFVHPIQPLLEWQKAALSP